ncbi:MAG: efflux RND transporter periplasmic adaptor subunit [Verrucomicrobia bacterium]|nr:efflux RND transporter periplasmic adaptor subunit [Verrucomicrobiota bacterium]MBU6446768.1 efflux RND transporter periplasmic adaptor subunit [Verrucomicrobiota bacterium]MDE3047999.1 efflux RND transporter periplasmic adaptor subunit [Verrucomicrobiota bacterium]
MKRWMILLLLCSACHKKEMPAKILTFPVRVERAVEKETPLFIEALGHVDSITNIQLKSRIEGELTGIYFTQGQEVKKGDLLFTIDPRPYEAALKEAQATLEENLANLSLAEEKVKRYRTLAKSEYFSQIDYETLQANLASTSAIVQQNRAQVESALINLNYCWIYAPIDGMMGLLQVDYGNLVAENGATLSTLNQMTPIYVTFSIPEFKLPQVQKVFSKGELKVLAAYENFSEEVFVGKLFMLDNSVDPNTGMITLRAIFENNQRELWPGQFIRTRLILATLPNAVVIPYTAVQMTQEGPVLFVVKDNLTVEQRPVTLGQRENSHVIVLKGLTAGETIVTEGQLNLHTGARVEIR